MNSITSIIIVGLLGVGIGFALGSLLASRGENPQAGKPKPAPAPNLVPIASLWSERGKKNACLQVDDKLIRNPNELNDDQRKRLKPYIDSLNTWFVPPASAIAPSLAPSPAQKAIETADAGAGSSPEAMRPNMNPVNVIARAIQSDVSVPEGPPKSIALQVDEILQEKLKGTPHEKRGIRLMELPSRGMVVMVGLNQYDSVDAVPDEEARGLIRSAVAEWEKRVSNK